MPSEPCAAKPELPIPFGTYDYLSRFQTLYAAHKAARRGKRHSREVMAFEQDLAQNLCLLAHELRSQTYRPSQYEHFVIREPKVRQVFAPPYRDRVFQHALCDTLIGPVLDRRLVYDNAACRFGKGTHFALNRLASFMRRHFRRNGLDGYVLRYDLRHYFASIPHNQLLTKLARVFKDERVRQLLDRVIASYSEAPGIGLPLGNQVSQWFALYYLDSLDRLVQERLGISFYSRYMDDGVLIHPSKAHLKHCLAKMRWHVEELDLAFNDKTQIFPLRQGISYLGFHSQLTDTGKVTRRVAPAIRTRLRRRMTVLQADYAEGLITSADVHQCVSSYIAHLEHGNTYSLRGAILAESGWRQESSPNRPRRTKSGC